MPLFESLLGSVAVPWITKQIFGGGDESAGGQRGVNAEVMKYWKMLNSEYNALNLDQTDAATVAAYKRTAAMEADKYLRNYDGMLASMGLDSTGFDTEKTRQKAMIASKIASDVANVEAEFGATRQARKAALRPNPAILNTAGQLSQSIDQTQESSDAAYDAALGQIGGAFGNIFKGWDPFKKSAPATTRENDWNLPNPVDISQDTHIFNPPKKGQNKYSFALPSLGF